MKFNLGTRLQQLKKDMFLHTQARLAAQYSFLIMVFLILFIAIVYFLVDFLISFDQERHLERTANQQARAIKEFLKDGSMSTQELNILVDILQSENQFFYYVVAPNGQLLFGDEVIEPVRHEILKQARGWIPQSNEIRIRTINSPVPRGGFGRPQQEPRQMHLMMTGRSIYNGDQLVCILYSGRNVSFIYEVNERLLSILMVIGILFLVVAIFLSYFMSKRAIIPIRRSFQRQREFVADASHELRTPLSILNSSLDVLNMEEEEKLSDFSRKVLSNMKNEVKRMTNMVSDLLTLARSDSGVPDLKIESFDLIPIVRQAVDSTQALAQSKEISLNYETPSHLNFRGDQERLKQLIYILLDNAIKFTLKGGQVNLVLSTAMEAKHSVLKMMIQDTGVGIPAEDLQWIFDRFYRVDKNRSRQMGGTGLGLAIAKWIVEAHHGSIEASSRIGEGSTFTVTMPLGKEIA
ncbi:sensor histidine kinase [Ammoniphilus sp. 3BR4]|uniref:sensor histidine kinase n=1 Tax=Ammoniphilus sp. 3BR4 TaxID=3158265 RepID=UPI003465CF06